MRTSVKLGIVAGSLLVVMTATAAAASQTITWVSVSADGSESGSGSAEMAVSDDGRFVAFRSTAALVPGYSGPGVYVKDVQTGAVDIVTVASDGTQANADGGVRIDMSSDGRFVIYESSADNLVADDTNNGPDVFIHDRETGETTRVLADDGSQGTSAADGAISGDGRYVVFTGQGFEAADSAGGVFVYDRVAGTSERVAGDGLGASSQAESPAISDDGRYVAFTTREFNGAEDVILFDRQTDTWEVANPRIGDAAPITRHADISISGDGRFVAFASPDTNLVAGDPDGTNDVFVYDADADTLERIPAGGGSGVTTTPQPVLSFDGRFVAFTFYGDIYGAANGRSDMAVHDRQDGTTEVVSVFEDGSAGDADSGSYTSQPAISGDGRFVAFTSRVAFDPADTGSGGEIYLVDREGTGSSGGVCDSGFTDVFESSVHLDNICRLVDLEITDGTTATTYGPSESVTRAQMGTFLDRALDLPPGSGPQFPDVDPSSVHAPGILAIREAGITLGRADGTYDPGGTVTRAEMASFLARAAELDGVAGTGFSDVDPDNVHTPNIYAVRDADITTGVTATTFDPDGNVRRDQMASFLIRMLDFISAG